jgi:hypothetical protein
MNTLGEQFPLEKERVRELLETYEELGTVGAFGAHMIRQVLKRSEQVGDDVVAMLRSYEELKGCK